MDGSGLLGLAALEAVALGGWWLWNSLKKARARTEAQSSEALAAAATGVDPTARLTPFTDGVARASLVASGEPCELRVDLRGPSGVECTLRASVPTVAMTALLREGQAPEGARLSTGDLPFDERFAVNARAPGVARVLSAKVRKLLLGLPRGASSPRLAVDAGVVELTWRGAPTLAALRLALDVVDAVRSEFQDLVPLR